MNEFVLSSVDNVVLVTLNNVANNSNSLASIFSAIGEDKINIDMICQTAPYKEKINLSFTIDENDLSKTLGVIGKLKNSIPGLITEVSPGNSKIMVFSELLKTESGIAARLFGAVAANNLQIKLITTSDVEISLLVDANSKEAILDILNKEFC